MVRPGRQGARTPGLNQSNQAAEVYAVLKAAEAMPPFALLHIISDSKYIIDGLTKHLMKWQDRGWINVLNAELFWKITYTLKTRSALTTFKWVKGHRGIEGNEEADHLAGEGAEESNVEDLTLDISNKWNLMGAKLGALTQALMYQDILTAKRYTQRYATMVPLDMARHCVHNVLRG